MKRPILASFVVALALGLQGCAATEEGPLATVEVAGSLGSVPTVTMEEPLPLGSAEAETVIEGDGAPLESGSPALLVMTAFDAQGALLPAGAGVPRAVVLDEASVGAGLLAVLDGTPAGSRVLYAQPVAADGSADGSGGDSQGAGEMQVVVVDVLPLTATGAEVELPADVPEIVVGEGGTPSVTVPPDAPPPVGLRIVPVIRGSGVQVHPGETVVLQFATWGWEDGALIETTWGALPATVAVDDLYPGLRDALTDQRIGSRVMALVPAADATGTRAVVVVADVLALVRESGAATQ